MPSVVAGGFLLFALDCGGALRFRSAECAAAASAQMGDATAGDATAGNEMFGGIAMAGGTAMAGAVVTIGDLRLGRRVSASGKTEAALAASPVV